MTTTSTIAGSSQQHRAEQDNNSRPRLLSSRRNRSSSYSVFVDIFPATELFEQDNDNNHNHDGDDDDDDDGTRRLLLDRGQPSSSSTQQQQQQQRGGNLAPSDALLQQQQQQQEQQQRDGNATTQETGWWLLPTLLQYLQPTSLSQELPLDNVVPWYRGSNDNHDNETRRHQQQEEEEEEEQDGNTAAQATLFREVAQQVQQHLRPRLEHEVVRVVTDMSRGNRLDGQAAARIAQYNEERQQRRSDLPPPIGPHHQPSMNRKTWKRAAAVVCATFSVCCFSAIGGKQQQAYYLPKPLFATPDSTRWYEKWRSDVLNQVQEQKLPIQQHGWTLSFELSPRLHRSVPAWISPDAAEEQGSSIRQELSTQEMNIIIHPWQCCMVTDAGEWQLADAIALEQALASLLHGTTAKYSSDGDETMTKCDAAAKAEEEEEEEHEQRDSRPMRPQRPLHEARIGRVALSLSWTWFRWRNHYLQIPGLDWGNQEGNDGTLSSPSMTRGLVCSFNSMDRLLWMAIFLSLGLFCLMEGVLALPVSIYSMRRSSQAPDNATARNEVKSKVLLELRRKQLEKQEAFLHRQEQNGCDGNEYEQECPCCFEQYQLNPPHHNKRCIPILSEVCTHGYCWKCATQDCRQVSERAKQSNGISMLLFGEERTDASHRIVRCPFCRAPGAFDVSAPLIRPDAYELVRQ